MNKEIYTTVTLTREAKAIFNGHKKKFKETLGGRWSDSRTIKELDIIVKQKG